MTSTARVLAIGVAAFLLVRGVAEFFLIDYGDPTSSAKDWGGPSLLGVLAVHSGPAVLILGLAGRRLVSAKLGRT